MAFYAYILNCADGSFYTGHTDNLEHRIAQHQTGALGGYTYKRRPVTLAWSESFQSRDDAKRVEYQIKRWTRAKKQALIDGDRDLLQELSRGGGRNG